MLEGDRDSAGAPLIWAHEEEEAPVIEDNSASDRTVGSRPTLFTWVLTLAAGISGLLFGYDTGVISSTLVSIGTDLSGRELTTLDKSLITSCTSLFALFASPAAGVLADKYGRKVVILIAGILFTLGALWQAVTGSIWGMIAGRSVVGLAVGGASLVVPLYISELAPPEFRGRLVVVSILFVTGGQMLAYVIGWRLAVLDHGWRGMVGLGTVPAVIQAGLLLFLPETPRWLIKVGETERARGILLRAYGTESNAAVEALMRAIGNEIKEEEQATNMRRRRPQPASLSWTSKLEDSWAELIEIDSNRRAFTIACMLQGLQQLCGFNSLMYFSATIFAAVGFGSPILASFSVAVTNFVFTLVAVYLIDSVGRRRILLLTLPVMVAGLLLTALAFTQLPVSTVALMKQDVSFAALSILFSLIIYVASYALGMGNVPWQQSELFPLSVRSLGSGVATSMNWGSNFVVGLTFLPMMQLLTPGWTFVLYAAICAAGWITVWRIYPETKGLGLEEVRSLLKDGWGVEESLKRM